MRYFLIVTVALMSLCGQAWAWGDEGHQVVALVAQSFLDTDVKKRVAALLAADTDPLTAHDIASEATWADKFRDANIEARTPPLGRMGGKARAAGTETTETMSYTAGLLVRPFV